LIKSFNNAAQPLNTLFSLPNFITFELNNQITIELTFIPLGNDPVSANCAGLLHCTPQNNALITPTNPQGLSAFNLDQNVIGTVAVFGVLGIVHGIDGSTGNLAGIFSTTFTGLNPQQALAAELAGIAQTYQSNLSLTVVSQVPEPATAVLSVMGLLGIAFIGCKKSKKAR
jgi:hypothetical protein